MLHFSLQWRSRNPSQARVSRCMSDREQSEVVCKVGPIPGLLYYSVLLLTSCFSEVVELSEGVRKAVGLNEGYSDELW